MPACKQVFAAVVLCAGLAAALPAAANAFGTRAGAAAPGFRYWDPRKPEQAPATLSAMGLYRDITAKQKALAGNAVHYEVNSPLWSDDAKKDRWVLLKTGTSIGFREKDDYWDYPDSAVFVKDFDIDTVTGDPASRVHWETRVLVNAKGENPSRPGEIIDQWYGFSYKWDPDQKEARLVPEEGLDASIRVWPQGTAKPAKMKKWTFPSRTQCVHCHRTDKPDVLHGRSILGFFTAQLNRPDPDSPAVNQLEGFFAKGLLTGKRPANWNTAPRWAAIEDSAASVDIRARSYIAANCSGCHGSRGISVGATFGVDLNYDFHAMEPQMELRHRTVSWSFGLDTLEPFYYPRTAPWNRTGSDSMEIIPAVIVPGYPQKSVLLFRQRSRDTADGDFDPDKNQMPPLASFEVNRAATALIGKWILEMSEPVTGLAHADGRPGAEAVIRDRRLILPAGVTGAQTKVSMASVDGREIALIRIAEGVYAIPRELPRGLYFVRIGAKSLLRYLF